MDQEKPATEQSETMPAESVSLILMPATVLRPILCFLVRLLFQQERKSCHNQYMKGRSCSVWQVSS